MKINELLKIWEQRPQGENVRFDYDNDDHRAWCNKFLLGFKATVPELDRVTTPTPVLATTDAPSNAEPSAPETGSNTHTQEETPSRADTVALFCQKEDTVSTSDILSSRLAEARAKAARAGRAQKSSASSKRNQATKAAGAPPAQPQTTQ
jgi:hypothetical protein